MSTRVLLAVVGVCLPGFSALAEEAGKGGEEAARARRSLVKALNARAEAEVQSALSVLVRAGGKENIEAVLKVLPAIPESDDTLYWDLIQGICSFSDREAMEHLGDTILRSKGSGRSRDLIFGLAKNRSVGVVFALTPILQKGAPDLQLMAAEKIGTVRVPEAVDALIEALKREEKRPDSELVEVITEGLYDITGQSFKINTVNWEGWWKQNREKPLQGPRVPEVGRTTGTVVDRLDKKRFEGFRGLERAPKKSVVVLTAIFPERERDENNASKNGGSTIEEVLKSMGVPHQVVNRPDFEKFDLRGVGALLINCAQFHEMCICPTCQPSGDTQNRLRTCSNCEKHVKFSAKLSGGAIKKIQEFVKRGGFLFCEDWCVKEVLERSFPQYVSAGTVLKKRTVDVVPARGRASHPYLRGIFAPERPPPEERDDDDEDGGDGNGEGGGRTGGTVAKKPEPEEKDKQKDPPPEMVKIKHKWAIDDEAWALKILDPAKVTVLLSSGKLQKETDNEGVVAFCFRPGADGASSDFTSRRKGPGVVLQVLSHFGKQESAEDEYTLQNLLVNFLIAANVARTDAELPDSKKPKKKAKKEEKAPSGEEEPSGKEDSSEE